MGHIKNKLYVSDLDQTLLGDHAVLSDFSTKNLNHFIEKGILFTAASARSVKSMQPILKNLSLRLPIIEFNGSFITDLKSGEHLVTNELSKDVLQFCLPLLQERNLHFFVSSFDGREDRLHYSRTTNEGEDWYVQSRVKDRDSRLHQTEKLESHFSEQVVCLTIINSFDVLRKLKEELKPLMGKVEIHIQENQYSPGWYWLTIHSSKATKDNAIKELCQLQGLEDVFITAFGDNTNDLKMLDFAHCGVAVSNALDEVKNKAQKIIGSNREDSVVKYIAEDKGLELLGV